MATYYIVASSTKSGGGCCCGCSSSDCTSGLTSCGGCGENYLCYGETSCEKGRCASFNSDCTVMSVGTTQCNCCPQSYKPINSSSSSNLHPCGAGTEANLFWQTSGYSKSDFSWGNPSCEYIGLCNYKCAKCTDTCTTEEYVNSYCYYSTNCANRPVGYYAGIKYCNSDTAFIDNCSANKYTRPKSTNTSITKPKCISSSINCSWYTPYPCPTLDPTEAYCDMVFSSQSAGCQDLKIGSCYAQDFCCGTNKYVGIGFWYGDGGGGSAFYCPACDPYPMDCNEIAEMLHQIVENSYW